MAWESAELQQTGGDSRKIIAIGIPHTGYFHTEFANRTWLPIVLPVTWCKKLPIQSKAYSLTVGRNEIVEAAIKNNADYILWVDTDMVVESVGTKEIEVEEDGKKIKKTVPVETTDPNKALKGLFDFMEERKDINFISALYRAKKSQGFSYAAWKIGKMVEGTPKYASIIDWTGNFIEIDAVGLGFALMRTEMFKKLQEEEKKNEKRPPHFKWNFSGDLSEDFDLCNRLKSIGYKLHLFTDIRLSHGADVFIKTDGSIRLRQA